MTSDQEKQATSDSTQMIRLERTSVGINIVAGAVMTIILLLVADVRSSIGTLTNKVDLAIKDVAVLQAQGLDARVRSLEAIAQANMARLAEHQRELDRLNMHTTDLEKILREQRKP